MRFLTQAFFHLFRWIPAVRNWEQDLRVEALLRDLRPPPPAERADLANRSDFAVEMDKRAEEFTKGLPYIRIKQ